MADKQFIRKDINGDGRIVSQQTAWWFDNGPNVQPQWCIHNKTIDIRGNKPCPECNQITAPPEFPTECQRNDCQRPCSVDAQYNFGWRDEYWMQFTTHCQAGHLTSVMWRKVEGEWKLTKAEALN